MEKVDKRPTKDEYYLNIAKSVALRSPCLRRKYGAVIVVNDTIVSTGYNGPARGSNNCFELGCVKNELDLPHFSAYEYCPAVHAEENAIINAARNGSKVLGGTLYLFGIDVTSNKPVPGMPCPRCKRSIINAGIKEFVSIDKNGNVSRIKVEEWVEEDKRSYEKIFKELVKK
ncbi:MAG: dCMP deaminase family protein [Candidatus Aenigmarchaeota archaeon]|nr:dCMP deaminase family protein [Candidatus Aenigmarchaeota archaeon]